MEDFQIGLLFILLGFITLEIFSGRFFNKGKSRPRDWIVEIVSTIGILGVTQPLIIIAASALMTLYFPTNAGMYAHLPAWIMFIIFVIVDDMAQYWWHRASHQFEWLYNLHRAHHNASYMSIRLTYRNNLFYYVFMPSIWLSAILMYLGFAEVFPAFIITKLLIVCGAHSSIKWDSFLYKYEALKPLRWLVQHTIITPAFHFAHHGKYKSDGVTNYKGNFGNMLAIWDIMFGTAKISQSYPEEYGVENLKEISWQQELAWPLVGAKIGTQEINKEEHVEAAE